MAWDLIGRAQEIADAADAIDEHRVVHLAGATGVGRTRVLAELADRLDDPDRPVFRVVATGATRAVPLSPFVTLLPAVPTPDRSLLLAQVLGALRSRGGRDGLVVAVDDAHHLDDASLALLALLDEQPDIVLAVTVCTDQPVPPGLRAVLDRDRSVRIDLGPLPREQADALLVAALGPTDERLADDVWRIAGGNPLLLRTLLDGATDSLAIDDDGRRTSTGPLTSRHLRDLVRDRLAHLPASVRPALEIVAVGAPVPYDVLASAADHDSLAALHDAGVIETTSSDGALIVHPTHPLYGELYADHAGEARRREAHRKLVDAAAAHDGAVDPLRIALWQRRTGDAPDPALVVAGAWAAIGRHDGAVAEELLLPVVEHLDGIQGPFALGVARTQQGRVEEAEAVFAEASDRATLDAEITDIASARAFNLAFGLRRIADADDVIAKARDLVDDGAMRGRLDAERGVIAAIGGDFTLALTAAHATIDNPDAHGANLASAYVSRTLADAMLGRCTGFASVAATGRSIAAECRAEMPFALDQIGIMEANALLIAGELAAADDLVARALSAPDASPLTAMPWLDTRAIGAAFAGRLDDAAAYAAEAIVRADEADPFALRPQAGAMAVLVAGQQGEAQETTELTELRDHRDEPRVGVWIDRARAWALAAGGDLDAAAAMALEGGRAAIHGQHVAWAAMALHDAVRFGHPEVVRTELTDAVTSTRGARLLETMERHGRALEARSAGDVDDVAHTFAGLGAWLLATEAMAQRSALLADTDPEESARAAAVSYAWESRCQSPRTPALEARPRALSRRALQIAGDAARGTSSADIAEHRFISVRTVDNHLGAVYRTLGVGGRDELAAVLGPHLGPPPTDGSTTAGD